MLFYLQFYLLFMSQSDIIRLKNDALLKTKLIKNRYPIWTTENNLKKGSKT